MDIFYIISCVTVCIKAAWFEMTFSDSVLLSLTVHSWKTTVRAFALLNVYFSDTFQRLENTYQWYSWKPLGQLNALSRCGQVRNTHPLLPEHYMHKAEPLSHGCIMGVGLCLKLKLNIWLRCLRCSETGFKSKRTKVALVQQFYTEWRIKKYVEYRNSHKNYNIIHQILLIPQWGNKLITAAHIQLKCRY